MKRTERKRKALLRRERTLGRDLVAQGLRLDRKHV